MKPSEFVSRVIDLYDFNMGSVGWTDVRPTTFSGAALCIRMGAHSNQHVKVVNGYTFSLECEEALAHSVIKATMTGKDKCSVAGSVCFTFRDHEVYVLNLCEDPHDEPLFETWNAPFGATINSDEVMSMLTFLTLKTDYKIRKIHN